MQDYDNPLEAKALSTANTVKTLKSRKAGTLPNKRNNQLLGASWIDRIRWKGSFNVSNSRYTLLIDLFFTLLLRVRVKKI